MKNFVQIISQISDILSNGLPGEEAQFRMAPLKRERMQDYLNRLPDARKGAVCMNLFWHEDALHTILMARPDNMHSHAGQVSFPGGKVEDNDPSWFHTAIREFEEETGINSTELQLLGELSPLYIRASNFLVKPYLTYSGSILHPNPNPQEVKELIYFKLDDLLNDNIKSINQVKLFTGMLSKVPSYQIKGYTVWGATAMILSEFEDLYRRLPEIR